jgi:hypothetical protein
LSICIRGLQALLSLLKCILYGDVIGCRAFIPEISIIKRDSLKSGGDVTTAIMSRSNAKGNKMFCSLSCYQLEYWEKTLFRKTKDRSLKKQLSSRSNLLQNLGNEVDTILRDLYQYLEGYKSNEPTAAQLDFVIDKIVFFSPDNELILDMRHKYRKTLSRFQPHAKSTKSFIQGLIQNADKVIDKPATKKIIIAEDEDEEEAEEVEDDGSTKENTNVIPKSSNSGSNVLKEQGKGKEKERESSVQSQPTLSSHEIHAALENSTQVSGHSTQVSGQKEKNTKEQELPGELDDFELDFENIGDTTEVMVSTRANNKDRTEQQPTEEGSTQRSPLIRENSERGRGRGRGIRPTGMLLTTSVEESMEDRNAANAPIEDHDAAKVLEQLQQSSDAALEEKKSEETNVDENENEPEPDFQICIPSLNLPNSSVIRTNPNLNEDVLDVNKKRYYLHEYNDAGQHTGTINLTDEEVANIANKYQENIIYASDVFQLPPNLIMDRSKDMLKYGTRMNFLSDQIKNQSAKDIERAFIWYAYGALRIKLEGRTNVDHDTLKEIFADIGKQTQYLLNHHFLFVSLLLEKELQLAMTREVGSDSYRSMRLKIVRKLLLVYYSLYAGFEGCTIEIINYLKSSTVKGILHKVVESSDAEIDKGIKKNVLEEKAQQFLELFKDLGRRHVSFQSQQEKGKINDDMAIRKRDTIGFGDTIAFNPDQLPRGRKKRKITQETVSRTSVKRKLNPIVQYEDITPSKKSPPTKQRKFKKKEEKTEEEEVVEVEDDDDDDEEEEEEEEELNVQSDIGGLDKITRALIKRRDFFDKREMDDRLSFSLFNQTIVCDAFNEALNSSNGLPFKKSPRGVPCYKCNKNSTIANPVRKCPVAECDTLNFCARHMEHCLQNKHTISGLENIETG